MQYNRAGRHLLVANVQCSRRRNRGVLDLCPSREGTPLHCSSGDAMQCKCAEGGTYSCASFSGCGSGVEWRTLVHMRRSAIHMC
jgi:hypothetical protein